MALLKFSVGVDLQDFVINQRSFLRSPLSIRGTAWPSAFDGFTELGAFMKNAPSRFIFPLGPRGFGWSLKGFKISSKCGRVRKGLEGGPEVPYNRVSQASRLAA
ncbi:hypothetical protein TNIN_43111 [Trichonephila inaurata madagascariensis]|uniref:Uncharacterized protein n=1 Tax=Trichonephila inaurata madagascariensis TaxID=2747483 RepID=A0A8X7C5U4_9ARAC|nr:hypothetical protein TNIN_43111 [Trichonephila inaurata madagascariensis]